MRAAGFDRAHVLGLSLGGRVAMGLAARHPDMVDRLVLVSTAARVVDGPRRTLRMRVLSRIAARGGPERQPRYAFLHQLGASTRFDGRSLLPGITAPTLVLHGRADRSAPYAFAEEVRDGIPGATLVTFDGGHHFPLTDRERFLAEVDTFLA
jgi:pimeloyl-ACP methyl ester carboxylesterase